jgi:hypothetical protein
MTYLIEKSNFNPLKPGDSENASNANAQPIAERALLFGNHLALSVCPSGMSCIKMKISMEHWWNDTEEGKPKYSNKHLSQYHSLHQKSNMD